MKIPLKYTINYIVHAISILDLDLLTQILSPLADAVAEKVQVAQYIPDFERIFRIELDFEDTYFEMVQGLCEMEGSSDYKYTFIANYSLENFTLKIEETFNSIIIIQEFRAGINDRQNRFSSFKGKRIDAPF
jgi:hypothetical protein